MRGASPADLLRPGLLAGRTVLVAGAAALSPYGRDTLAACTELGAEVSVLVAGDSDDLEEQERLTAASMTQALEGAGEGVCTLVIDAQSLLAGETDRELLACMQSAWDLSRACAEQRLIAGGDGGRILLVAPNAAGGRFARAAGAGLENLARTLSIEWARYAITAVAVAPGEHTTAGEVAQLCAFLASPAGDYFSGCLLDLRGARPATVQV